eukprot:1178438-Prorocentrum_minimum.AAC.5
MWMLRAIMWMLRATFCLRSPERVTRVDVGTYPTTRLRTSRRCLRMRRRSTTTTAGTASAGRRRWRRRRRRPGGGWPGGRTAQRRWCWSTTLMPPRAGKNKQLNTSKQLNEYTSHTGGGAGARP